MNSSKNINLETVNCNLCGSRKYTYLFSERDRDFKIGGFFEIARCKSCGLIFTNPRPSIKDIRYFYPNNYGPHIGMPITNSNFIKKIIFRLWEDYKGLFSVDLVKNLVKGKILDIGCGSGAYLNYLRKKGWQVAGLDVSPLAVKQTRRLGIECFMSEVYNADFRPESFNVVTAINTIEHMHNPLRSLKKINEILKKNGTLIIVVPNVESLEAKIFGRHWHEWDIPRHLYHFSLETLTKLLELANFNIILVEHESRIDGLLRSIDLVVGEKTGLLIRGLSKLLYPAFALFERRVGKGLLIIRARKEKDANETFTY